MYIHVRFGVGPNSASWINFIENQTVMCAHKNARFSELKKYPRPHLHSAATHFYTMRSFIPIFFLLLAPGVYGLHRKHIAASKKGTTLALKPSSRMAEFGRMLNVDVAEMK